MKTYFTIANKVWKILGYILAALFFAMMVVVFWQVFCRFVLKDSSGWTSESSMIIFVWTIYLGAALAIHSGQQIAMTMVVLKLKSPVREIVKILAALICELMYVLLTWSAIVCMDMFAKVTTPSLGLPVPIAYASMLVSGVVMVFFGIEEILKPIMAIREKKAAQADEKKKRGEQDPWK